MAERPPKDPAVEDILAQVKAALAEVGIEGRAAQEALVDGVREALHTVRELGFGLEQEPPVPSAGRPDVTVVPGGRSDASEADSPPRPRPDLRVAELPEEEELEEDGAASSILRDVRVRIIRSGGDQVDLGHLGFEGQILLGPGARQDLFIGGTARPYRIAVDAGQLSVSLDGAPSATLGAGQTLDVEARVIQVHALSDATAKGRYRRLGDGGEA